MGESHRMTRISHTPRVAWNAPGWIAFVGCLLIVLGAIASPARAADLIATDIRVGAHGDRTRIVVDLSRPVDVNMFLLEKPYRVVVDTPEIGWQLPANPLPKNIGIFSSMRYGLYQPGQSRMVFEMSSPPEVLQTFYLKGSAGAPYRLVIDMRATDPASFPATANKLTVVAAKDALRGGGGDADTAPTTAKAQETALASAMNAQPAAVDASVHRVTPPPPKPDVPRQWAKRVIVIDAGHGGVDPGAISRSGAYEKNITLAFAKELRRVLDASGHYEVYMVRDRDVFVPLRQRVARARKAKPDLFISLHANTIGNSRTRGLSVYTLSEKASDKEAALLADKENKVDIVAGMDFNNEPPEVANILIDLAQRESMNESARFANILIHSERDVTRVLHNTHRFAGFVVLKAPDVPSVLVELGFLSNKTDEQNLLSHSYRRRWSKAALSAIDEYFENVQQAHTD